MSMGSSKSGSGAGKKFSKVAGRKTAPAKPQKTRAPRAAKNVPF